MKIVITFGTFDLFHVGHLNMLKRAKEYGDYLIVGLSSDSLNIEKKGREPIFSYKERFEILSSLKFVDEIFKEEIIDKEEYCKKYKVDIFVIGDDWKDKKSGKNHQTFDEQLKSICEVKYLKRTPSISTTEIIEKIKS